MNGPLPLKTSGTTTVDVIVHRYSFGYTAQPDRGTNVTNSKSSGYCHFFHPLLNRRIPFCKWVWIVVCKK